MEKGKATKINRSIVMFATDRVFSIRIYWFTKRYHVALSIRNVLILLDALLDSCQNIAPPNRIAISNIPLHLGNYKEFPTCSFRRTFCIQTEPGVLKS